MDTLLLNGTLRVPRPLRQAPYEGYLRTLTERVREYDRTGRSSAW